MEQSVSVFRSLVVQCDGGQQFALDDGALAQGHVTAVAVGPANPSVLAVGTRDVGMIGSKDGGTGWERWPHVYDITTVAFTPNGVFACLPSAPACSHTVHSHIA